MTAAAGSRGRTAARALFLLAIVAACTFLALGGRHVLDIERLAARATSLRALAQHWGALGLGAFVLADAAALSALVVPAWFCTLIAGLLFGPWVGATAALAGTVAGASAVFAMARAGFAKRGTVLPPRWAARLQTHALVSLIALRLLPVVPFTLVNIAAGLAGVGAGRFALGTAIGILPSVVIYARLGDALLAGGGAGERPGTGLLLRPDILLPLLALALLAVVPALLGRLGRRRGRPAQTGRPT